MQLLLTQAELQLLADLLEQKRYDISHSPLPASERELVLARDCEDMLGRVIERDIRFSSDELSTLSDLLNESIRAMKGFGAGDTRRARLEAILDKLVEATAMV